MANNSYDACDSRCPRSEKETLELATFEVVVRARTMQIAEYTHPSVALHTHYKWLRDMKVVLNVAAWR